MQESLKAQGSRLKWLLALLIAACWLLPLGPARAGVDGDSSFVQAPSDGSAGEICMADGAGSTVCLSAADLAAILAADGHWVDMSGYLQPATSGDAVYVDTGTKVNAGTFLCSSTGGNGVSASSDSGDGLTASTASSANNDYGVSAFGGNTGSGGNVGLYAEGIDMPIFAGDPDPPDAGVVRFYAKSDGLYAELHDGTVMGPFDVGGGGGGGASTSDHFVTTRAEADLSAERNLGSLSTGLLYGTVSAGESTISSKAIGTDVQAWDQQLQDIADAGIIPSAIRSMARHAVADANYTASTSVDFIYYTSLTATRTVTLPSVSSYAVGQVVIVKDCTGIVDLTHNITIDPTGAETIDGQPSAKIYIPWGSYSLVDNGTEWSVF